FQDAIDRAAMVSGETSEEAYLEGWTWGPVKELPGTADRVVNLIVAKLDMEYPDERLEEMVRAHRRVSD
ncbi:MAG TPA: virulence factor, partial [Aggregatilineales bacterium]|nr:virulence factor [Aggregatilineales bacterium]